MTNSYAKIVVKGSPLTKSNFKLFNAQGRAILPYNSGKYHDRYALYEEEIAYEARLQNPDKVISEALIAVLRVYYKSEKRHPDTINITKSIFDGIEKSGLIINDAQIRTIITEEFYDKENPRFELELFGESEYSLNYTMEKRDTPQEKFVYDLPANKKSTKPKKVSEPNISRDSSSLYCDLCGKALKAEDAISADRGNVIICRQCFNKLF